MLEKNRFSILYLFALIPFLLVARLCFWTEPYAVSVDESTYLTMAEVLQRGGVLYRDVVDRKPPGLIWLYEGIARVFGTWNIHGVHFSFLLILMGLVALAYQVCFQVSKNRKASVLAAIFFGLSSSCFPREILSANAEYPMLLCMALSTFAFFRFVDGGRLIWLLAAALLAAVATLFKQYGVLIFIPIFLGWAAFEWRSRRLAFAGRLLASVGICVAAFGVVYGLVCFYFFRQGAFDEFLNYFLLDGLKYVAASRGVANHATSPTVAWLGMLASWPVLWWGAGLSLSRRPSMKLSLLAFGALGALVTIFLSGRYYTHYFVPLIWFLSVLAAIGLADVRRRKLIWAGVLAPFVFFAAFNFNRELLSTNFPFSRERQAMLRGVSAEVRNQLGAEDRMVVWGMASQIYVMSERGTGTRFLFADFVSGRQPGYKSDVSVPTPGAQETFLADLLQNKPKLILDTSGAGLNDYQWFPLKRFPTIMAAVEAEYRLDRSVRGIDFWLLK